jgi:hypothetical protein
MIEVFQSFLNEMMSNFRRIAKATHHEKSVDDLAQDAWIVGEEISEKRKRNIDFSNPADRELVMRYVNHRNVKRGDWNMRKAIRIDKEPDGGNAVDWSERLTARASSDPLISILLRESALNAETILSDSYSQAVAYVRVFANFKNCRQDVCAYLIVCDGTLARRVAHAAQTVKIQPSLFDRIEKIGREFMPTRGKQFFSRVEKHLSGRQWEWLFEE